MFLCSDSGFAISINSLSLFRHLIYQVHLFGSLKSDESAFQAIPSLAKFLEDVRFPEMCIHELQSALGYTKTSCTGLLEWYKKKVDIDEPTAQIHKLLCPLGTFGFGCDGVGESFIKETLMLLVFQKWFGDKNCDV